MGSSIQKVLLYTMVPFLFILTLAAKFLLRVFRYIYDRLTYAFKMLLVFLYCMAEKQETRQSEFSDAIEFTGFAYDPGQDMFYSTQDAWQRNFGYCRAYDEAAAPFGMIVDCEPVYFEYGNKTWVIEFWKGQYDMTTGGEIGIYVIDEYLPDIPGILNSVLFRSARDDEMLKLSFSLEKNGETLFRRDEKHWWLTGFKLGEFSNPSELTMKASIAFPDEAMCSAFIRGMKAAGYSGRDMERSETSAGFIFGRPKMSQPFTRTKFTDRLIQMKNRYLCSAYRDLTGDCRTMQEKLGTVRKKAPKLYRRILRRGAVSRHIYGAVFLSDDERMYER